MKAIFLFLENWDMREKVSRFELKERLYRRRYVFPNLVTLANLFCGFLAIIYATSFRFNQAVFALLLAIILDGLDGRVARRLNATSRFGLELDSFSDLVSFGVAPAILMYRWCFLSVADEFGVMVCFVYVIAAALRLARFNISAENLISFQGLPSPAAAFAVAALVFSAPRMNPSFFILIACTFFMLITAFLMISNLKFISVKTLKLSNVRGVGVVLLGSLIALLWYIPRVGLLLVAALYMCSGLISLTRFHALKKEEAKIRTII